MIDTPTHTNIADFKQRYQGDMGWLNPEKTEEKRAVFVASVSSSKVGFKDVVGNDYYANVNTGVQFEFLPTQRAWYNTKDTVLLVQRIPARQWKRGVCPENTSIIELVGDNLYGIPITLDWRASAFKVMTDTVPYQEAVANFLAKGRSSVALSKHFALCTTRFYFLNLEAGFYTASTGTIALKKDFQMVRQELQDLINRNKYALRIAE